MSIPKTHAHVMQTQLNIKGGLKAFGNKMQTQLNVKDELQAFGNKVDHLK